MVHEFQSFVRYSECDQKGDLTLDSIVNYFQDVSSFQGEYGGIGIDYLKENHLAWMLSFWQIILDHSPHLAEKVTAQTWAYDFKGFYGLRNFTLLDASAKMAAWANSVWVLFDTEKQKPVQVPQHILDVYGTNPKLDMDYASRKVPDIKDGTRMPSFIVERHHLDTNRHVNNRQYISMAMEYLPEDFRIRELRVEYKKQALLGDEICPVVHREDGKLVIALRGENGRSYAVVEFYEPKK